MALALELVECFHSAEAAQQAYQDFTQRFQKNELPENLELISITSTAEGMLLPQLLKAAGLTSSTSDANRMIEQGAVRIDGERAADRNMRIEVDQEHIYQVGKHRVAKIILK